MNYETLTREELIQECEVYEKKYQKRVEALDQELELFKEAYHKKYWPRWTLFKEVMLFGLMYIFVFGILVVIPISILVSALS